MIKLKGDYFKKIIKMNDVKIGKYKHFKGRIYEVIGVAKHSETFEEFMIYKNSKNEMWARPKQMFFEKIIVEGRKISRFKYID